MTAARSELEPVVLRELPQHTRPLPNELLSSFRDRLAARNGLSRKALSYLVDTSGLTQLEAVSQLTGLQSTTLTATLPELRVTVPRKVSVQIADQITSGYRPSTANHDAFARLLRD
jgi:hypothetical protein